MSTSAVWTKKNRTPRWPTRLRKMSQSSGWCASDTYWSLIRKRNKWARNTHSTATARSRSRFRNSELAASLLLVPVGGESTGKYRHRERATLVADDGRPVRAAKDGILTFELDVAAPAAKSLIRRGVAQPG